MDKYLNKITCIDCLEGLKQLKDNSIDLIVIDPPYFNIMLQDHKGVQYDWDRFNSLEDYLSWIKELSLEIRRVLKDNGSFYIFADDKICAYIQVEIDKYFNLENSITWVKPNNMTIKGWNQYRMYAPITEKILFYSQKWDIDSGKLISDKIMQEHIAPRNKFAQYMLSEFQRAKNNGINVRKIVVEKLKLDSAMLNRWTEGFGSIIKKEHYLLLREYLNNEYLKAEYEDLKAEYEDLRRYFKPEKNYTDVWTFNIIGGKENVNHPTQKPIKIIERIIKTSSRPNDIVLDCFMGSGTTAVACKESGRNFIGFEISEEYCKIAEERLKSVNNKKLNEWFTTFPSIEKKTKEKQKEDSIPPTSKEVGILPKII